jgi:hypothetical protein
VMQWENSGCEGRWADLKLEVMLLETRGWEGQPSTRWGDGCSVDGVRRGGAAMLLPDRRPERISGVGSGPRPWTDAV